MAVVPNWLRLSSGKAILGLALTSLVAGLSPPACSPLTISTVMAGHGILANVLAMPLVTLVVMPAGLAVSMLLMPFGLDALPLQVDGHSALIA
jgi:competence protein ComEC